MTARRPEDLGELKRWLERPPASRPGVEAAKPPASHNQPLLIDAKVHPGVHGVWLADAFRAH
jgi:hypothetical protein